MGGETLTDGVVTLRRPVAGDRSALVALRDDHFRRFMGPGSPDPRPTFCVTVDGGVLGWVDFDRGEREWLPEDAVNIGYALDPAARGRGLATRSVQLLLSHIARSADVRTGTLAIDHDNVWSQAVAERTGFRRGDDLPGSRFYARPIPPLTYTDGVVTIRPLRPDDAPAHVATIDEEQIRWLWLPGQREAWEAMSPGERLDHVRRWITDIVDGDRVGPKHAFAVDAGGAYVGYADCDLANPHVPAGEANLAYSIHPDHRGRGHAVRAVQLVRRFVADHTGAREAHLVVDSGNEPSLRVARAVEAVEAERWTDDHGRSLVRHVLPVCRSA